MQKNSNTMLICGVSSRILVDVRGFQWHNFWFLTSHLFQKKRLYACVSRLLIRETIFIGVVINLYSASFYAQCSKSDSRRPACHPACGELVVSAPTRYFRVKYLYCRECLLSYALSIVLHFLLHFFNASLRHYVTLRYVSLRRYVTI